MEVKEVQTTSVGISRYQRYKETIRNYQKNHKEEIAAYYREKNRPKREAREREITLRFLKEKLGDSFDKLPQELLDKINS